MPGITRPNDIVLTAYSPLGQGRLADNPEIGAIASRHGATAAQVALAWLLHRSERILLIPGTTSVGHLEENVAAGDLQLSADDLARLEEVQQAGTPRHAGAHQ